MNIIKKEIIVQVGKIKLHDLVGGELVVGFSNDGSQVYTQEKEEEGGGNENCRFWFVREDSEYFKLSGEEFIDKKLDCELSEKYNYVCRLDDYWNEVKEKFGVKEDGYEEECDLEEVRLS